MAQELLNHLWCRPSRVRALLALLRSLDEPVPEEDAVRLMVNASDEGTATSFRTGLVRGCEGLGLVRRVKDRLALAPEIVGLTSSEVRCWIACKVLSAREPGHDHYRFCRLYAWMLASFETLVEATTPKMIEDEFNHAFGVSEGDERINDVKINVALDWASELGLGWWSRESADWRLGFQPIPAPLVGWLVPKLMTEAQVSADIFLERLSSMLPCFDRGEVFQSVLAHRRLEGRLSPGLSRALRRLHEEGVILLESRRDAPSEVQLSDYGDASTTFASFVSVAPSPVGAGA